MRRSSVRFRQAAPAEPPPTCCWVLALTGGRSRDAETLDWANTCGITWTSVEATCERVCVLTVPATPKGVCTRLVRSDRAAHPAGRTAITEKLVVRAGGSLQRRDTNQGVRGPKSSGTSGSTDDPTHHFGSPLYKRAVLNGLSGGSSGLVGGCVTSGLRTWQVLDDVWSETCMKGLLAEGDNRGEIRRRARTPSHWRAPGVATGCSGNERRAT